MIAQAPATCGAAMEVPVRYAYPAPGTEEYMLVPGASNESQLLLLDETYTTSDFVVFPTLMALEMQAGALKASTYPLLPEATIAAMPAARRLSIIAFVAAFSASHAVELVYP